MSEATNAIFVEITATRGSAPRDKGTAMKVTKDTADGTIGGGALEHRAIATARQILADGGAEHCEVVPLGPGLGQCCGGSVALRYGREPRPTDSTPAQIIAANPAPYPPAALWLWGAGHVGRAVVQSCPPEAFAITWIDSGPERFPQHIPDHATPVPTPDMPRLASHAPREAHHLIFTYSHEIDLALCAALLQRGAASIGLIGSDTKWVRFSRRLTAMGLDPDRIICPIGDKTLGKAPHQIAHGTIRALLSQTHSKVFA